MYAAVKALGVNPETEPIFNIMLYGSSFNSGTKITDIVLFDVTKFEFT